MPWVYRINLRDTRSYFLEQTIQIRNRDMLYVANAPLNELQKVIGLFSTGPMPADSFGACQRVLTP